jgi:hypothetical protein
MNWNLYPSLTFFITINTILHFIVTLYCTLSVLCYFFLQTVYLFDMFDVDIVNTAWYKYRWRLMVHYHTCLHFNCSSLFNMTSYLSYSLTGRVTVLAALVICLTYSLTGRVTVLAALAIWLTDHGCHIINNTGDDTPSVPLDLTPHCCQR